MFQKQNTTATKEIDTYKLYKHRASFSLKHEEKKEAHWLNSIS
jgi:hypothetical protein